MDTTNTLATLVTALTTNVTPSMLFGVYSDLLPWIGGMAAAGLAIYTVRRLIKGFRKGGKTNA